MSAPIEPRVRYHVQFLHPTFGEWVEYGDPEKAHETAKDACADRDSYFAKCKTRILKTTTTFEVVEEMEPKA